MSRKDRIFEIMKVLALNPRITTYQIAQLTKMSPPLAHRYVREKMASLIISVSTPSDKWRTGLPLTKWVLSLLGLGLVLLKLWEHAGKSAIDDIEHAIQNYKDIYKHPLFEYWDTLKDCFGDQVYEAIAFAFGPQEEGLDEQESVTWNFLLNLKWPDKREALKNSVLHKHIGTVIKKKRLGLQEELKRLDRFTRLFSPNE